ncbi:alpha-ketoglutarate decarboxylase [Tamlana sp. 2201CG12-4]|uniref:alpha-ketoglutarate decarboxylase n=1 Tax=Tamlana sp. 2201CG12-4 TaxID=3112582 RepID=UPI002DB6B493|nr:alpha-ketoglutarate decarboxylase [Tamlana sp. 2201CG12-4]MEC3905875.1 alpha-ketoglutarate decarboxylase [Tamlana sp. 2201CG12-4]
MMNLFFPINKKIAFFLVILSISFQNTIAQEVKSGFWNQVRYGGNIGLSFGDGFFSGTIAPSAIFEFDRNFALGLGLNATFNNRKNTYKSTILGASFIGLYNVIRDLQLSAEFEQLNVNRKYDTSINLPNENFWAPALYLGAGYRSGNVTFGIRYDVIYDKSRSVYSDPWSPFFRVYF